MKLLKIRISGLVVIAAVFLLLVAGNGELIREGIELLEADRLEEARQKFLNVLETEPDDERALYYLSQVAHRSDERREAFKYFDRLARREPGDFEHFKAREVYQFTGILAHQIGEYSRAIELLEKAQSEAESETVYQRLEGWRQRARAAHLRQLGKQREERLENLLRQSKQYLERGNTRQALNLLLEHRDEFEEIPRFSSQINTLRRRLEVEEWREQSTDIDR
ncbi:MAG: tetratricopeptide repeat protein, partial [bacterium]